MSLKEYNQYELRFLQVLVPRKKLLEIMVNIMKTKVDKFLWHGDSIVKTGRAAECNFIAIDRSQNGFANILNHIAICKPKEAGDYLEAIKHANKLILGHPDDKLEFYDQFGGLVDENGVKKREHDPEKQICEKCGIDMEKDKWNR